LTFSTHQNRPHASGVETVQWQDKYQDKLITAQQAAKFVKNGDRVVFSLMAQPKTLGLALAERKDELKGVTLMANGWTEDYPWFQAGWEDSFQVLTAFITRQTREAMQQKRIDWMPAAFGLHDGVRYEAPMRDAVFHGADVFWCKVTPPDEGGWCSFGNQVWYSPNALRTAKLAIVEIDETLPFTYGDNVHVSEIDYLVESPPLELGRVTDTVPLPSPDDFEKSQVIGAHVSSLINDGDTLEIGTGTPTESVLSFVGDKNDLGIHSELIYTQVIDLIKEGVITGKHKNLNRGKHLASSLFLYATDPRNAETLRFVDRNPAFEFRDISHICNVPRITSMNNMIAINAIMATDLLGQANITHLGATPISGPGGQVDFTVGAHYSRGGKSISCLLSTAKNGTASRIVPRHSEGAVLLVPCEYIDYLVTEHGMVNLNGKTARQRAEAIISIADPQFQPWLKEEAKKMFWP
ncbi:acetyl-CoA hydrolase/transferase family protein, partial [Chloroflexota bacterium]